LIGSTICAAGAILYAEFIEVPLSILSIFAVVNCAIERPFGTIVSSKIKFSVRKSFLDDFSSKPTIETIDLGRFLTSCSFRKITALTFAKLPLFY
jgi:hypothetical protein